jgi:ATP-dependent HslUV protease ATP-binding subunit HslU
VADTASPFPQFDFPGGQMGMINLSDMMGKAMGGGRTKRRKMTVEQAYDVLIAEESDNLLDDEDVSREAVRNAEQSGIVFIDEIDKIAVSNIQGGSVSREGVQRDLLPLIEGTTVSTKHGPVKTDHILFIASGAFSVSKPSDLLPELQGRLPIRVELKGLTKDDFKRILTDTEASLIRQYRELLGTEKVTLTFTEDGIEEVAKLAFEVNESVENIGARRLHTMLEKLLDEISFTASERGGESISIDGDYVRAQIGALAKNADLSKFIL